MSSIYKEMNYLCEHLYFCFSGDFKNKTFLEHIMKLRNYYVNTQKVKNYFDQVPLMAYAELYNDIESDYGIYNVVFRQCNNKDECLKTIEKDCDKLYKQRN